MDVLYGLIGSDHVSETLKSGEFRVSAVHRRIFYGGLYRKVKKNRLRSGRFRFFLRSKRMDECADPVLESSRRVIYGQSEGYMVLVDLPKGPKDLSSACMALVGAWVRDFDPPDIRVNH